MSKTYEITIIAEVENEDDIQTWLKEHNKDTDKVKIKKWGIDLYQEKYTIDLKHADSDKSVAIDDLDELLCAISKSIREDGRHAS